MLIWPFSVQISNNLSKKTIVEVRGGGGQRSMVKDHNFMIFNFGTLPLLKNLGNTGGAFFYYQHNNP